MKTKHSMLATALLVSAALMALPVASADGLEECTYFPDNHIIHVDPEGCANYARGQGDHGSLHFEEIANARIFCPSHGLPLYCHWEGLP